MKEYILKRNKVKKKNLAVVKFSLASEDRNFETVKNLSFHAARLYNSSLFEVRQYYFANNKYLNYVGSYHKVKENENYKLLITDIGQLIIRNVDRDMKSFFALCKLKSEGRYSEKIGIPKYKDKDDCASFAIHGRSVKILNGVVSFALTKEFVEKYQLDEKRVSFKLPRYISDLKSVTQLRIIPRYSNKVFDIEFVYEKDLEDKKLDKSRILSIDMGLDNFATLFSELADSLIIDGRKLKSINQYYNKQKAKLQSEYEKQKIDINTERFIRLSLARKNKINDYFNKSVTLITNHCISNNIGTIVIGDFSGCKENINLGKKNNQNFVSIPYYLFKQKLESKCKHYGIQYILQEESYSSKCSSLDLEEVKFHNSYKGKRVKRGLFQTENKILINADLNGAVNILRKYKISKLKSDLSDNSVRAVVIPPLRLNPIEG